MSKNKIFKIIVFSLLVTSMGSIYVMASSNSSIKNKVDTLTSDFNSKKNKFEKKGTYKTNTEEAKKLKEEAIKIDNLNDKVKTEADYRVELEEFIEGCKLGLEDTKQQQETDYSETRQEFIEKMEEKIDNIETEMNNNDKANKSLKLNSASLDSNESEESSSKELLDKLLDSSDVDN